MTSLLSRLLRLFPESVPLEDLFTEAVARLFETRPDVCIGWLEEVGVLASGCDPETLRVRSQRSFAPLDHHDVASRPDLLIEAYPFPGESDEYGSTPHVVMIESKVGSKEGAEQLRRYAEHLGVMVSPGKTLLYLTRAYDPKDEAEICRGLDNVGFVQLRWHDLYRFLQKTEKDALIGEVTTFMEEQGMARSYRFSTTDLITLSGVPRAFEIFDETLGGEVRAELETFAGTKVRRETHTMWGMRIHLRYHAVAYLHGEDLFCGMGYQLGKVNESTHASILQLPGDGYPAVFVFLEARPNAVARETSVEAMTRISLNRDWKTYNLDNSAGWAGVRRAKSLADILSEEDHIAAVKSFFIESIGQLREDLASFKKEEPGLLWNGV